MTDQTDAKPDAKPEGTAMSEVKILTFRPEAQFPVAKRQKAMCKCRSTKDLYGPIPSVWIDEATMDLECKSCGARLSAFDYLWQLATEGESLGNELKRMREEKISLSAQNKLLEEQNRELRAEGRKLSKSKPEPILPEEIKSKVTHMEAKP